MLHLIPLLDTFCLFLVGVMTVLYINTTEDLPWCLRWGLALIIGGSFGSALEYFWPSMMVNFLSEKIMHVGMAVTAIGFSRDNIRKFITNKMRNVIGRG